jgi:DNA replication and repair protein RecF
LARGRARDLARRTTGEGPHLDDLAVAVDGHAVVDFASQGQTRALVLALKLAELRRLHEVTAAAPLLLLDDVSSELDPGRNERLFATLFAHVGQCLLTTTATTHVRLPTDAPVAHVHVDGGRLSAAR